MGHKHEKDLGKYSPRREIASVVRPTRIDGLCPLGMEAASVDFLSSGVIVHGTSLEPLVSRASLGQSLLVPGHDRRSKVLDTALDPWNKICSLEITAGDGSNLIGTGWIAGPRLILTAGHCVFDSTYNGWVDSITVIPGRNGDCEPYGRFVAKDYYSLEKWILSGDENFDVGAIILEEDVGLELGYFSFGYYPDDFLRSQLINISGYPASVYGEEQMHHANRVCEVKKHKIYYDVDTEGGQSGSPVWFYPDPDMKPVVVGVHSNGAGFSLNSNSGVRITPAIAQNISEWRALK